VVQRITDRLGGRTASRQLPDLRFKPDTQVRDQRCTLRLTQDQPVSGTLAANPLLDLIKRRDTLQRLDRDRRLRFGQIVKAPAHMAPAKGQRYGRLTGPGADELLVGSVAVALKNPAVAAEQRVGVRVSPAWRVVVNHRRRITAAPWSIVSRDRPEVALFGPPATRIEYRDDRLIGEYPGRGQHHLTQPRHHRGYLRRGVAHPKRQSGTIDDDALPRHDLSLTIKRLMIRITRHRDMRDQRLGRNAAFDQARWRRLLHHDARAGSAGEFWTFGHDHPKLHRDHVEPFRGVFADHGHLSPAAGARGVLGRQRHLDPRQMSRQRAAVRAPPGRIALTQLGVPLLRLGVLFGDRLLEGFEAQLQLFFRQTFGPGTKLHPRQLQQQMAQPVILCL
jgi:hypothetical protein